MKIENELRKMRIISLGEITATEKKELIEKVVTSLINTFPTLKLSYDSITKLYNCNMYRAKIDSRFNRVNYFYKNKAIYFDESSQLEDIDINIIHECIHYLQDVRKQDDRLYKMGICEFNDYKIIGLGLNEFVLQYISKRMMNLREEKIESSSILELYATILLKQLIFLFGEELIVESAIYSNGKLKEKFMDTFQEEDLYYKMTNTFDEILEEKQKIDSLLLQGEENEIEKILKNIEDSNRKIYSIFEKMQVDIFNKYFNIIIKYIDSIEEVEECKEKILSYRNLIECYESETEKYNQYVEKYLKMLDKKVIEICRKNSKSNLTVFRNNPIINLFNNIRKALFKKESY